MTTYTYNAVGRLMRISHPDGSVSECTYDESGIKTVSHPDGSLERHLSEPTKLTIEKVSADGQFSTEVVIRNPNKKLTARLIQRIDPPNPPAGDI